MPASRPNAKIEIVDAIDQTLVDRLRHLYSQLYPDRQSRVESYVSRQTLTNLVESSTDMLLVVKDDQNRIIGTATLSLLYQVSGCVALIETFIIDQDHRGQGLGRLLLDRLVELAEDNQVRIISLVSGKHRPASHRLYERGGFSQPDSFYYSRQLRQFNPD